MEDKEKIPEYRFEESVKYESPKGLHRHKCEKCGYVWEHSNSCAGSDSDHECPKCKTEEWCWYEGPEPPTSKIQT